MPTQPLNHLAREKSPYLLQHSHNPVDWYPWGEEAFAKARAEDKPIFLSIGYSSCHWCHVMERECFEDEQIAYMMNRVFVNIKVDREERPDIDDMYMKVCQMMTGGGGWPLSIIMRPDKRPFYAATFIPPTNRGGMMGMLELVPTIEKVWTDRRDEIDKVADQVMDTLRQRSRTRTVKEEIDLARAAFEELSSAYEEEFGGFEVSPKFPTPHKVLFLLRYGQRHRDEKATEMALWTLRNMSLGGIYDHVGYGFHRYSTDRRWFVPHFEKMLYDQALHVMAYTEAYLLTKEDRYRRVACNTLEYVLRDLTSAEGGFLSSEDADSEGVEGKFYTFTEEEVVQALGLEDDTIFMDAFDIRGEGNFREEASGRYLGRNILRMTTDLDDLALQRNVSREVMSSTLISGLRALYGARERRVRPFRDDKVLLDWNGLTIAALAKAYRAFGDERHRQAAVRAVDFIETRMVGPFESLRHRYRDGETAIPAFLNDLAFYIWGLLELFMATFELRYLKRAKDLAREMIASFGSAEGDFFLSFQNDDLLMRGKEHYDGAIPSGNSVAIYDLFMLYHLTQEEVFRERAEKGLKATLPDTMGMPSAYAFLAIASEIATGPGAEVLVSDGGDPALARGMLHAINSTYVPDMLLFYRQDNERVSECQELPHIKGKGSPPGQVTVHICEGSNCLTPIRSLRDLEAWLHRKKKEV